jgi:hypothetical protein
VHDLDAAAELGAPDTEEFRAAGIGDFDLYEFEREATSPDGSAIKMAFVLAFARDGRAPDVGFFTCLHRFPEQFWNPAFQVHPNTASAVAGVILVAENPSDHHIFLAAFTGQREMLATSSGIAFKTRRGEVSSSAPSHRTSDEVRGSQRCVLRSAISAS